MTPATEPQADAQRDADTRRKRIATPISVTAAADTDRVRQLAQAVDCITEGDLCALAAISPATAETWRKRGKAPPYLILGNRALYLRKGLQEFIERQAKQPREGVVAGDVL